MYNMELTLTSSVERGFNIKVSEWYLCLHVGMSCGVRW